MSSVTINGTRIEPLLKDNYETWKMQIEALLEKVELWEYVNGESTLPPMPSGPTDAQRAAAEISQSCWKKSDRKARAELVLAIHPSQLPQVRNLETSREVWLKLESIYASKGPARKATLLKQLILHRMNEGEDVRDHLNKFFDAVDKLEAMELSIDKDLLSIMLLYSLPSSYDNFRIAIESRDDLPSPEDLKVKIIEEYDLRAQIKDSSVIGGLAAKFRGKSSKGRVRKRQSTNESADIVCYKCGRPGFKSPDCPCNESANSNNNKPKGNSSKSASKPTANNADDTYFACHTIFNEVDQVSAFSSKSDCWILDSGCTAHLCGDEGRFCTLDSSKIGKLNLASNSSTVVEGKGAIKLPVTVNKRNKSIELQNTLFVPDLRTNLMSVAKITDTGAKVIFEKESAYVVNQEGDVRLEAMRRGDLYYIKEETAANASTASIGASDVWTWHNRLGHLNVKDLCRVMTSQGLPAPSKSDVDVIKKCEICTQGKMTVLPFPKGNPTCSELLKIVHTDVVGPIRTQAVNGAKWFVTFIDDNSRWCEVYFLKQKSGVVEAFQMYKNFAEKQTGHKIKCVQSDRGGEYVNTELNSLLTDEGIERRLSVARTPQQNGTSERMNRTLLDMARCLLINSGLPVSFWSDAIATACYIRNRCPSSSLGGLSPYEKWTGEAPNVSNLRIFGTEVHVLDKNPSKDKFASRSFKGIFVGYPRESKGYRVWLPEGRKTIVCRDVKFLEKSRADSAGDLDVLKVLNVSQNLSENLDNSEMGSERTHGINIHRRHSSTPIHATRPNVLSQSTSRSTSTPRSSSGQSTATQTDSDIEVVEVRRAPGRPTFLRTGKPGRPRKLYRTTTVGQEEPGLPEETDLEDDVFEDAQGNLGEDFAYAAEVSLHDALSSNEKDEWINAIVIEIESLIKNDTFKIVKIPETQRTVGCRVVLTNKYNSDGSIGRRKARIVAKGYSQKFGVDYNQTFAPVARMESIRLLLALSAEYNLKIWQFDVVTAFLNGELEEEVFMEIPDMLRIALEKLIEEKNTDPDIRARAKLILEELDSGGNACLLIKALYGLKQAGKRWNRRMDSKLRSIGLMPTINEPCLYVAHRNQDVLMLALYVDDGMIASSDEKWAKEIIHQLRDDFEIKDLGLARNCLGLEVYQETSGIKVSQKGYTKSLLEKYGMTSCNPVNTPAEIKSQKPTANASDDNCDNHAYRELIGALMYLSTGTRPDIANTVSRLAQFVSNPTISNWNSAKRVLRYLAGTADLGLSYTRSSSNVIGYSDADWGGCNIDRKSYSGYIFLLGGGAISWKSQKQRTVALSSTEAEYVSMTEAVKEGLYLQSLLTELGFPELAEILLYVDNRGAQCLANDHVYHPRSKHIDIKYHFVRDAVTKGKIQLEHTPTEQMTADYLTKALPKDGHWRCLVSSGFTRI